MTKRVAVTLVLGCQPHGVTSGPITISQFFYTSSEHKSVKHMWLWYSFTNHLSVYPYVIKQVLLRQKPVSIPSLGTVHIQSTLTMGTCWNRLWLRRGWLISVCGPARKAAIAKTQLKGRERRWREKRKWRSRKIEIKARKTFLAVDEACVATFWPIPGFKERTLVSSGFSTEETLISVSGVLLVS